MIRTLPCPEHNSFQKGHFLTHLLPGFLPKNEHIIPFVSDHDHFLG